MRVLVAGAGAREHAILATIARTDPKTELFCAPGNGGTDRVAETIELDPMRVPGFVSEVRDRGIELVIIGPEAPLCAGLADALREAGVKVLGPNRAAARLEASKVFAKQFMRRHNIPTADFWHFHRLADVERFVEHTRCPLVVKADGLAGGKGVTVCETKEEVLEAARICLEDKRFGEAGQSIIIENGLSGKEVSIFCLTDGRDLILLPTASDYKRAFDGDTGPNTGGMGAISPGHELSDEQLTTIIEKILLPTMHGMRIEGTPYAGILYVGLMLTQTGPRVLEYNVRLGDPEAQAVLSRLRSSFMELVLAAVDGDLTAIEPDWDERPAVNVVLASKGYPESPVTGRTIEGADAAARHADCFVYHGGTRRKAGRLITSGGRVLSVTALGETIAEARKKAYDAIGEVTFDGAWCRGDIASGL